MQRAGNAVHKGGVRAAGEGPFKRHGRMMQNFVGFDDPSQASAADESALYGGGSRFAHANFRVQQKMRPQKMKQAVLVNERHPEREGVSQLAHSRGNSAS